MSFFRILLTLALLLIPFSVQAKVTFGVVPHDQSLMASERIARDFARLLEIQLGEEVIVQTFANEAALHEWISRYRLVDLAVLSDGYLSRQIPGEFFPLAHPLPGTPTRPEQFVARQGLYPWLLHKLQRAFAAMSKDQTAGPLLQPSPPVAPAKPGVAEPIAVVERPAPAANELVTPSATEVPVPPTAPAPAPAPAPTAAASTVLPALPPQVPEPVPAPVIPAPAEPETTEVVAIEKPASAADESELRREPEPRPATESTPASQPPLVTPAPPAKPVKPAQTAKTGEAVLNIAGAKESSAPAPAGAQRSYSLEQVADGIYAAISRPGGHATSNAFFVVGPEYVVAGGAHMSKPAVTDLVTAIASVTDKPLRHFILSHHHRGYNHIDFEFPEGVDLLISWPTWKTMDEEGRKPDRTAFFFTDGLTLKFADKTIILTNMGPAHSEGDTLIFFPEAGILFTSDLVYVNSVGYLGDGHMEDWLLALEFVERVGAKKIIPGFGPPSDTEAIVAFKEFFRALVSEVLKHIEQGDSLERTMQAVTLPDYAQWKGYEQFIRVNVHRAYLDLKENFPK